MIKFLPLVQFYDRRIDSRGGAGRGRILDRWTAEPTVVAGCGMSREEAILDWKRGLNFWLEYMRETGQPFNNAASRILRG